jgi:hypothetical protein
VAALPFPMHASNSEDSNSEDAFLAHLRALLHDAPSANIPPSDAPLMTPAMRALRSAPLDVRRQVYIRDRVDDQRDWYRKKAGAYARRAGWWRAILLFGEVAGVALAICRGFGIIHVDLASIVATGLGASAAWLGVRQHEHLARAYTFAHGELSIARERLMTAMDEDAWAAEAADAEEAVSREHTMWRASKSSVL